MVNTSWKISAWPCLQVSYGVNCSCIAVSVVAACLISVDLARWEPAKTTTAYYWVRTCKLTPNETLPVNWVTSYFFYTFSCINHHRIYVYLMIFMFLTDGDSGALCAGPWGLPLCSALLLVLQRETRQVKVIRLFDSIWGEIWVSGVLKCHVLKELCVLEDWRYKWVCELSQPPHQHFFFLFFFFYGTCGFQLSARLPAFELKPLLSSLGCGLCLMFD